MGTTMASGADDEDTGGAPRPPDVGGLRSVELATAGLLGRRIETTQARFKRPRGSRGHVRAVFLRRGSMCDQPMALVELADGHVQEWALDKAVRLLPAASGAEARG